MLEEKKLGGKKADVDLMYDDVITTINNRVSKYFSSFDESPQFIRTSTQHGASLSTGAARVQDVMSISTL